jgi:hypothetical protein
VRASLLGEQRRHPDEQAVRHRAGGALGAAACRPPPLLRRQRGPPGACRRLRRCDHGRARPCAATGCLCACAHCGVCPRARHGPDTAPPRTRGGARWGSGSGRRPARRRAPPGRGGGRRPGAAAAAPPPAQKGAGGLRSRYLGAHPLQTAREQVARGQLLQRSGPGDARRTGQPAPAPAGGAARAIARGPATPAPPPRVSPPPTPPAWRAPTGPGGRAPTGPGERWRLTPVC